MLQLSRRHRADRGYFCRSKFLWLPLLCVSNGSRTSIWHSHGIGILNQRFLWLPFDAPMLTPSRLVIRHGCMWRYTCKFLRLPLWCVSNGSRTSIWHTHGIGVLNQRFLRLPFDTPMCWASRRLVTSSHMAACDVIPAVHLFNVKPHHSELLLFASLPECSQNQTAESDALFLLSDF